MGLSTNWLTTLFVSYSYESPYYGVGYAYASSPLGPYYKSNSNPILSQDASRSIYSTGHGSIIGVKGSNSTKELYYPHHARPTVDSDRHLYNARLFVEPDTLYVGFGADAGDLRLPSGVAPFSISSNSTGNGTWTVNVENKDGVAFNLSSPANRLFAWIESGDASGNTTSVGVDVEVVGENVTVAGALPQGATINVVYQRARANDSQPWLNVSQVAGLGADWELVGMTLD